jgi:DNA-binding MarR family transcriptional regulator
MLKLDHFLPYRLSVLSNQVSQGIAQTYIEPFNLSVIEWRILAILGREEGLSATEVAERSAMDKVSISRAVKRLIGTGRLTRRQDQADGRSRRLRLTDEGRSVYEAIAPAAMAYEEALLGALSPQERAFLDTILDRLLAHTKNLTGSS